MARLCLDEAARENKRAAPRRQAASIGFGIEKASNNVAAFGV